MELKEYILPLRKWWWLLLASTLVAGVSSFIAVNQQPATYRTHTTLMVGSAITNPNPTGNDFWLTQQLASSYADIAKREPVRTATMKALGLSWLPEYTVRVVPNTQLMEITVVDTDPQRAQIISDQLAQELIRQSPTGLRPEQQQRQAFIDRQLADLEASIDETKDGIDKKQEELASLFSARQIADTQTQIGGLQNKLSSLQSNYAALLTNTEKGAVNTITIIEPAALPTEPVGPNKPMTILLALAIGFLLAAGAAYLLEYLDDTLKNPDDVQKILGLTTLGAVPALGQKEMAQELITLVKGRAPATESYRILRTNLQFASVDRALNRLLITSPSPSEGKSLTVANLAVVMAQAGNSVIVVDTDLHRPRQHRLFKVPNSVGLTTALLSAHPEPDGLLQETPIPGLKLLTSGPLPPNPAELLGSQRMKELLDRLQALADVVILDSPPATMLADAAILSTQSDGVLLVLDSGSTRREIAHRALEGLRQVNAHLVGALLNRMPTRGSGYYYYYYYYYSKDGYYGDGDNHHHKKGRGLFPGVGKRRHKKKRSSKSEPLPQPLSSTLDQPTPEEN
ncbi:MAG: polysaccharide biosynthesis tyrosine autokinase [Chloroflexi bacterium]|nr:polysaccharide biosynthesis tyrosine autokinase [Chloroflexota bacterium]